MALPAEAKVVYKEKSGLGYNCVKYARTIRPDLPQGLWTLQDKTKLIRTHDNPQPDMIVVTKGNKTGGHLGVVVAVGEEIVLIRESNYLTGFITLRKVKKTKILGYF